MTNPPPQTIAANHFDVLIVGAGISGIGSAYHLQQQCPDKRYVILEMKDTFGGTWETHKYPGVRSDSDLYTFGYRFKPWVGPPIATAEKILKYMGEVIEENDIDQHIRYGHRISGCSWSSDDNLWTRHRHARKRWQIRAVHLQLFFGCARATTTTSTHTPLTGQVWPSTAGSSSTPSCGIQTSTTAANASWSSARERRPPL